MFLFCYESLFIGDAEKYAKEGSGKGQLSPLGPRGRNFRGAHFTGDFDRQMEGSGNGASLSMGALRGEPGGGLIYWGS